MCSLRTRKNLQVRPRYNCLPVAFFLGCNAVTEPTHHKTINNYVSTGTVIGRVVADDADGDTITYYIDPGTINANNFDVNESTGEVSLERQLDREVYIYMRIRIRLK